MPQLPGASAVPYVVPVPTRRQVSYTGGIAQQAGVQAGQATAEFGQAEQQSGLQIQAAQDQLNSAAAEQSFLSKKLDIDQQFVNDQDPATAPQRYRSALQGVLNDSSQGLVTPTARAAFQTRMSRWLEYGTMQMQRESARKVVDQGRGATLDAVNQAVNDALRAPDPTTRNGIFSTIQSRIDAATQSGWFTQTEAAKLRKSVPEGYALERAKMMVDTDPAAAAHLLAPSGIGQDGTPQFGQAGDWRDFLDPSKRADLVRVAQERVTSLQTAAEVNAMRAERLQQKAEQDAADGAANDYITALATDPSKVDPTSIAMDKRFAPSQWRIKDALIKMAGAATGEMTSKDVKTYGPDFWSLYQRVNAPQDDPNRITDPSDLFQFAGPGKGLTLSGVKELSAEIQGKRTPQGEAESEMKRVFLQDARSEITGTNEGLGIKDPKGDELYLKFLAQALPAYDAGRRAGKTAAQLLDPGSPDYVGKSISTFKRPMSQWTADMLGAGAGGNASPQAKPGEPDLSTPQGLISAVNNGQITRADGEALALKRGWIRQAPAAPGTTGASDNVSVPISR